MVLTEWAHLETQPPLSYKTVKIDASCSIASWRPCRLREGLCAMSEVRAFLGHSFTKNDEAVIEVFLKHFTRLQNSPLAFSWVSAEPAEPTELAEKVLKLMGECNVFIAICTKKECVISSDELRGIYFPYGFLKARTDKFLWKTSDWIIQEIGLAIGKGLRTILLIEEGLRKPGGLQGNIEYIEFTRVKPEACFDKILEMLGTLMPKVPGASAPAADPRSSPVQQRPPAVDNEWWRPIPSWGQFDYDFALMRLIAVGDAEKIKLVNDEYAKSPLHVEDDNALRWEALNEFYQLAHGTSGTISKLRQLVQKNPNSIGVQEQLAKGLAHIGEGRAAARTFETAAGKASTSKKRVRLLALAARAFARSNQDDDVARLITEMRVDAETMPELELQVLDTLVDISRTKNDLKASIPPLERIVELNPDDYDARFSLAYAHSQKSNDALALFHYMKIPDDRRTGATWNNVGVSSDEQGLAVKAVAAYKNAETLNETLAMSNLAAKYLKAGFLHEAMGYCEKALQMEKPHRNVGLTWAEAKSVTETEALRLDKILAEAAPISDFYRLFGHAETRTPPEQWPQTWIAREAPIQVTIKDTEFIAEGRYETVGLAGLLTGNFFGTPPSPQKYFVTYRGVVNGRTVRGTVDRGFEAERHPSSLLSNMTTNSEVLMVLTHDGSELKVMETLKSPGNVRFYSLLRQT
jgi:tetratricopeptide (TPR) repeat protein